MKIRSLLLGSLATVGFATAGHATDLGVVTSLNVCDEQGLSGLAISSDDNCLVITGGVTYEFKWGDYYTQDLSGDLDRSGDDITTIYGAGSSLNSSSDLDAWLQFVATADSSMGPATATIKLLSENSGYTVGIDKAFITIGDTTMLTAGKASSIFKNGDDEPLNFLGLFNSEDVNTGVGFQANYLFGPLVNEFTTGGDVIQLVSDLGNGVWVGGGLEDLNGDGTAVGVISYAGDGLTAHVSLAAGDILDGTADGFFLHAGFTGTFDKFKIVGAIAADDNGWYNVLGSASATFDMFTLAGSVEATSNGEYGVGGSVGLTVSDGVSINLGARFWHNDNWGPNGNQDDLTQVAAQLVAAVSDDVTLTGEVGAYIPGATDWEYGGPTVMYAKGKAAWAPGGGVDASVSATINSLSAWQTDFLISKSIK